MSDKFKTYLLKKQGEFDQILGKRTSQDEFAEHLGINQSVLSNWMDGNYKPSAKSIAKLVKHFGAEVYDALDLPRPDDPTGVNRLYKTISEVEKKNLKQIISEWADQHGYTIQADNDP